jgi:hypothetical protein
MAPKSLPRDIDLPITISMAQTEIATDMTLACILTPDVDFSAATRIRFYDDFAAFADDVPDTSTAYRAGLDFFGQQKHPTTLAVGRIFTEDIPPAAAAATLTSAALTFATIAITNGALSFTCGTTQVDLTDLDFSTCEDLTDVVAVLNDGGTLWTTSAGKLICTSAGTGATQLAVLPATGTLANLLGLSAVGGGIAVAGVDAGSGYDYVDFPAELAATQTAAIAVGRKVFCWLLDASYRDTGTEQHDLAVYALATDGWAMLCTNDADAKIGGDTTTIGAVLYGEANRAAAVIYHDNAQYYPDAAYAAQMLACDFNGADTALTMKFKDLMGIATVQITETELSALKANNINTFTAIGNNSRTVREGIQSAPVWYTDTYVNLMNFKEELQVEVYNVFLRRPKVPYTERGQALLVEAAAKICHKYVVNGVFADRQVEDTTAEAGFRIEAATKITPMPIYSATTSMRAARLAPPIQILAYLAGAIHKVAIDVEVVQ